MSDLPPYIRDADQSPPPPPEAVQGQAGRPAVSPPQESALSLSGGGMPPETRARPELGPNVVSQPGHVPYVQPYEPPPGAGENQPAPTRALATAPPPAAGDYGGGGDPAGFVPAARQGPVTQVVQPGQAVPAGRYTEDSFPIPDMHRADSALPVTPGPGGTAAVQSPEPAKTAAAPPKQQPAQEQPLHATPGGAAVQTEPPPTSAQYKGQIPVHSYNHLGNTNPELFNMITEEATRVGVTPQRLIHTAAFESKFNNAKPGKDGETSMFQILPSTQLELERQYFGGQHFDLTKPENVRVAARMSALYIRQMDDKFGADSYASVAAYNGGPGFQTSPGRENAMTYAAKFFDPKGQSTDYSKFDFGSGTGGTMTANGVVQASKGGPDSTMRYIVDSAPRGLSMSDGWQHAQSLMVNSFLQLGDIEGAEKAQDFMMRQAFMGSNTHLMGAAASLERGDGMTAAQQLAKAHAFFPDGTAGRFMTNGREVFGVRLDEATGKPLGSPFKITAQEVRAQLQVTGNPMTFSKFLSDQQKSAAETRLHNAQAGVAETKPAIDLAKIGGANARAQATIDQHERGEAYKNARLAMQLAAKEAADRAAKDPETLKQLNDAADKALNDPNNPWPIPPVYDTPEKQSKYNSQRTQMVTGLIRSSPGMSLPPGTARYIAQNLLNETWKLHPTADPKDPTKNGWAVVDAKGQRVPGDYAIDTVTGESIKGEMHPARELIEQQKQQRQGGAANSASASGTAQDGGATGASLARYVYDPSNEARLGGKSSVAGVSTALAQRIHTLYGAMPLEIQRRFEIISGYRDAARQREVNPDVKHSQHGSGTGPAGTGRAVDLRDDPAVLNWIHQNGPRVAGVGFPLWHIPKERNHLEMVDPQGRRLS